MKPLMNSTNIYLFSIFIIEYMYRYRYYNIHIILIMSIPLIIYIINMRH